MNNQRKIHALIGVLAVTIISVSAVLIPYLISLRDQSGQSVVPTDPDQSEAAGVVPTSGWDNCNNWQTDTANYDPVPCRQEASQRMPQSILSDNPMPDFNGSDTDWRAWSKLPDVDRYLSLGTSCALAPSYCLPKACGQTECNLMDNDRFDDCEDGYTCVAANDGKNYCAKEEYKQACSDDPSVANCCSAPEPTPTPIACGMAGCVISDIQTETGCAAGYTCVAGGSDNYCALEELSNACSTDPNETSCCTIPSPTPTPTATPKPGDIVTTIDCRLPDDNGVATLDVTLQAVGAIVAPPEGDGVCGVLTDVSSGKTARNLWGTDEYNVNVSFNGYSSSITTPPQESFPIVADGRTYRYDWYFTDYDTCIDPASTLTDKTATTEFGKVCDSPEACVVEIKPQQPSPTPTPTDQASPTPTNTPAPDEPRIDIEKSTNGIDADEGPGPELVTGESLTWRYVVTNTGDVPLKDIVVTDDREGVISCPRTELDPGEKMTCAKDGTVNPGQYANSSTVEGVDEKGRKVSDTDPSHYHAGNLPTNSPTPTSKPGATNTPVPNQPTSTPTPTIYLPEAGNVGPTVIVGGIGILVGILAVALLL